MSSAAHRFSGASFEAAPELPPVMAEVDLLPSWYPQLWRRRRLLRLQFSLTLMLVVALLAVLVWWRADVEATQVELASLEVQRRDADATLSEVVAEEARLSSLHRQSETISHMGLPLEVSRVLAELDAAIPREVAMTAIDVRTEARTIENRRVGATGRLPPLTVRQMHFSLKGLAEKRETPFAFAESLRQRSALFAKVEVVSTQSEPVNGRSVEVFEIRFRIDLSAGGGAASSRGGS